MPPDVADDRHIDPVEDGFDVVIRVNPKPDETLVGRCFLKDQPLLVAPATLAQLPRGPDPASVPAVLLSTIPEPDLWHCADGQILRPAPVLRLSSLVMMHDAVRAGAGAAVLPPSIVQDDLAAGRVVAWGGIGPAVASRRCTRRGASRAGRSRRSWGSCARRFQIGSCRERCLGEV